MGEKVEKWMFKWMRWKMYPYPVRANKRRTL